MRARALLSGLALALGSLRAQPLPAAEVPAGNVRTSLYVFGSSEHGSGPAYAPPHDDLVRDDALELAAALDASRLFQGGRFDASVFTLVHDPFTGEDRGLLLAARARATFGGPESLWKLRIEDSSRVQRRETVSLSDFFRNELWVETEHRGSGPGLGLRLGDRRRLVPDDPEQEFDRQSLSGFASFGSTTRALRLEGGPQRYSIATGSGWRLVAQAEFVGVFRRLTAALHFAFIEPISETTGSRAAGSPTLTPTPRPTPPPMPQPLPSPEPDAERPPESLPPGAGPGSVNHPRPPLFEAPSLLGPSLVVDGIDSDEGDLDFGRRKQELSTVLTYRFPGAVYATLEALIQRERGPDLLLPEQPFITRDNLALRLSFRKPLGKKVALLVQGGYQNVRDSRPGASYTTGIVSAGVELRP